MIRELTPALFVSFFGIAACAAPVSGEDVEQEQPTSASEALSGGGVTAVPTGSLLAYSTVHVTTPVSGCTGVLVGKRHVLTAAHCEVGLVAASDVQVYFYASGLPTGDHVAASTVDIPSGVVINPGNDMFGYSNDDLSDTNGTFADVAVLTLSADAPGYTIPALLPLSYPGSGVGGTLAGTGSHGGTPNKDWDMRYLNDQTRSGGVSNGAFMLETANVDKGDSGGPFYTLDSSSRLVVHGVLSGTYWDWAYHAQYTSITFRLSWILAKMKYDGGMSTWNNQLRGGTAYYSILEPDWRKCALRCAQSSSCKAYNHYGLTKVCSLLSSSAGALSSVQTGTTGAK